MTGVTQALAKHLQRAAKSLHNSKGAIRLIEPVNEAMWGRGGLSLPTPQLTIARNLLPASLKDSDSANKMLKDSLTKYTDVDGVEKEGFSGEGISALLSEHFSEDFDVQDGFALNQVFVDQSLLQSCTSSCVTDNLVMVEGTSKYIHEAGNSHFFCYRLSISNVGDSTFQLQGRQWIIKDGSGKTVAEVPKGSPGVVGFTPVIQPGERFIYASGTELPSRSGVIAGSFQMAMQEDGAMFDAMVNPIHLRVEADD